MARPLYRAHREPGPLARRDQDVQRDRRRLADHPAHQRRRHRLPEALSRGEPSQRRAVLFAGRRQLQLGAGGDRRGEGERAHAAGADLDRDVAADQRLSWPHPGLERRRRLPTGCPRFAPC